tara:strand:- start:5310 stop:6062 length:753 start_codon:yes stop_codon:yes gene_type:complete
MSGHSKWSTIKRKKGANDAKRGQVFSRFARELQIAAKLGGADPDTNYRLKMVIGRARGVNMPQANIDRAIKRGAGGGDGAEMLELTYEGYGPGGVALLIDVITDNRNRSVAAIRNTLDSGGGHMADSGGVAWMFNPRGEIVIKGGNLDEEEVFMSAAEAGAEDIDVAEDRIYVWTGATALDKVRQALANDGYEIEQAELGRTAKTPIDLELRDAIRVMKLIETLEDLDDVRKVDSNLNISEDLVESFAVT